MKERIVTLLKKYIRNIFYLLGVHIKFYSSPKSIHDFLRNYPFEVQQYELRNISDIINVRKSNDFYNKLLKLYVPNWNIKIIKSEFIRGGKGAASLNTYRKLENNIGEVLFEKIYYSSSRELNRVTWLDEKLSFIFHKGGINIPKIKKVFSGKVVSILYYHFEILTPYKEEDYEESLIFTTKKLYEISLQGDVLNLVGSFPNQLKDFKNHFHYNKNINLANEYLSSSKINIIYIEEKVENSKLIITHGDIHKTNIFQGEVVIDWDSFGLFPVGFDVAYMFFQYYKNLKAYPEIENWLYTEYKDTVDISMWNEFETNFFYFLFVFYSNLFKQNKFTELKNQLINLLQNKF